MNLINSLLNVFAGPNNYEAVLMEIRSRTGGILIGSVNRLDRVSDSELVIYYQTGRINGSMKIKSTRQTLNRYESAMCFTHPRIALHKGADCLVSGRAHAEIDLDS